MPTCTVIPELEYPHLDQAIAWLRAAFGFELRLLIGNHRAQLHVGNGAVVIKQLDPTQSDPMRGAVSGHSIMVRVDHVDAHHARAVQQGATILQVPADYPYGERQYTCRDIAGHIWKFSQTIADVAPDEWGGVTYRLSD